MRTTLTLYCNVCGRLFTASESTRRFCSQPCAARFRTMVPVPQHAFRQSMLLAAFRQTPSVWIPGPELAERSFGISDTASMIALRAAVARLRQRADLPGLAIDVRRPTRTAGASAHSEYRLTQDTVPGYLLQPSDWEVAS